MFCKIQMNTNEDVMRVSREAALSGIEMTVSKGHVIIDPRSVLGLFGLVGETVTLVAPDDVDHVKFGKIVKRMGVAI
jgi:hypothetical protein